MRPIPVSARLLLSLFALTTLAHGLALLAPLQFDDEHQILLNPAMRDPASIPRFFVDPWIGSSLGYLRFYRPVRWVIGATAFLVSLAGLFGGLNTLYAAFAARVREIGMLQALGFTRGAIILSLLQESLLASASGAILARTRSCSSSRHS